MPEQLKITFSPLKLEDIKLRTKWIQNPKVKANLGWQIRNGVTHKDNVRWFNRYQKNKYDKRFTVKANGIPVGLVGLTGQNPVDKHAELFIMIGEDEYRGLGIGRKACEYIIKYGFEKLKLHKIFLAVYSYNLPAINLYKSLGFEVEGVLKEQVFYDQKYQDEIQMGLINPSERK
ncbi:MAG: GNAT family protein [Patescibacteria group bacterium]|jgi:RimJ/RimL family protein N-acetyltransferase